jgi:hypothetical protein
MGYNLLFVVHKLARLTASLFLRMPIWALILWRVVGPSCC